MFVKHKKTGAIYSIVALQVRESDLAMMVAYTDPGSGLVWLREASEFFDGRFEVHIPPKVMPKPSAVH